MLTTEGRVLEEIWKTKFNLRSGTEEEDEVKIAPRPMNCHKIQVSNHSTSFTNLSNTKPLSTCNYTSNMGRSIRGLEILPTAHARTHTRKHTALSEVHRSLVSAERTHDPVHKLTPLCDGLTAHLVVSDVSGSIAICGRCTWHAKHQLVSGSLHTWPL